MGYNLLTHFLFISFVFFNLSACTTIKVHPVDASTNPVGLVKIIDNPNSGAEDLQIVIERAFQRHGFGTQIVKPDYIYSNNLSANDYTISYSSSRKWDLAFYLGHAEIYMKRGIKMVGDASYNQAGGFNFAKWGSTESKMGPILDRMLEEYRPSLF
jgi:hypothetical protein